MSTTTAYQPKTGQPCHCRRGAERDNCPACEGTGMRIDFQAIRAATREAAKPEPEPAPVRVIHSGTVAIQTRYIGPSNTRGSRIVADAGMGRRIIVSYDHDCNQAEAHARAARALCAKWGWEGTLLGGEFDNGGHAFVFLTPLAMQEVEGRQ